MLQCSCAAQSVTRKKKNYVSYSSNAQLHIALKVQASSLIKIHKCYTVTVGQRLRVICGTATKMERKGQISCEWH